MLNSHAYPLPRRPGMGVFSNVENVLAHLSVLAYPNDPPEIRFKNFDLVVYQGDKLRDIQKT